MKDIDGATDRFQTASSRLHPMTPQLLRGMNSLAPIRLAGWINPWIAKNGNVFSIAVSPYPVGMKAKAYQ